VIIILYKQEGQGFLSSFHH